MYCKIKIVCKLCKCTTEIEANTFQASGHIACPNCGQAMPENIYGTLATAMTALASLYEDTVPEGWGDELKQGFLLSVSGEADTISPSQQSAHAL